MLVTDVRDLAELASLTLRRRLAADRPPPIETLDVVAPDVLPGDSVAGLWSELLGRPVGYQGDDLDLFEASMREFVPVWMAHDFRLVMRRFQTDGMIAAPGTDSRLRELLGRPMRSYVNFAREAVTSWGIRV